MRHDVDVPDALPRLVRGFRAAADADAGVGAEEVDGAVFGFDAFDEVADIVFLGDVRLEGDAADLGRDRFRAGAVEIGADDAFGTFLGEALRHRAADAARRAGDDDGLVLELHRAFLV